MQNMIWLIILFFVLFGLFNEDGGLKDPDPYDDVTPIQGYGTLLVFILVLGSLFNRNPIQIVILSISILILCIILW